MKPDQNKNKGSLLHLESEHLVKTESKRPLARVEDPINYFKTEPFDEIPDKDS
jgi:hypothetical protein